MKTSVVVLLFLATTLHAQTCDQVQSVTSRSDRDFKVQWIASCGGTEVLTLKNRKTGELSKEIRAHYSTFVTGKGKLSDLKEIPDSYGRGKDFSSYLLTVEGLQDHAIWVVHMYYSACQSEGVKFWKIGDIISLETSTDSSDNHIPKIQDSIDSTRNITHPSCDYIQGCFIGGKWQK